MPQSGECELCHEHSDQLENMLYQNEEDKLLCPKCWGMEAARGDLEAERQLEEQETYDPDDPDHERRGDSDERI